jgi:hypothetical protein
MMGEEIVVPPDEQPEEQKAGAPEEPPAEIPQPILPDSIPEPPPK